MNAFCLVKLRKCIQKEINGNFKLLSFSGSEKQRIASNIGMNVLTFSVILCFLVLFLRTQKSNTFLVAVVQQACLDNVLQPRALSRRDWIICFACLLHWNQGQMQAGCECQGHSTPFTTLCQPLTFLTAPWPWGDPTVEGQMQENTYSQF